MRMPTRLHITWESESVLKIETDSGQQTRRLRLRQSTPAPAAPIASRILACGMGASRPRRWRWRFWRRSSWSRTGRSTCCRGRAAGWRRRRRASRRGAWRRTRRRRRAEPGWQPQGRHDPVERRVASPQRCALQPEHDPHRVRRSIPGTERRYVARRDHRCFRPQVPDTGVRDQLAFPVGARREEMGSSALQAMTASQNPPVLKRP